MVTRETDGLAHPYPRDCKAWCCGGAWNKKRVGTEGRARRAPVLADTNCFMPRKHLQQARLGLQCNPGERTQGRVGHQPRQLEGVTPTGTPSASDSAKGGPKQSAGSRKATVVLSLPQATSRVKQHLALNPAISPAANGGWDCRGAWLCPLRACSAHQRTNAPFFEPATVGHRPATCANESESKPRREAATRRPAIYRKQDQTNQARHRTTAGQRARDAYALSLCVR